MIDIRAKIGKNTKLWFHDFSNIGACVIGEDCRVHTHVWIGDGVKIGDRVKIQAFSFIPTGVTIGNDVFIGPQVCFTNDKHPPSKGEHWAETIVEDGVVIGAGAIILPGITLHRGCVVGAGAVVTKSVKSGKVVVGNPARVAE